MRGDPAEIQVWSGNVGGRRGGFPFDGFLPVRTAGEQGRPGVVGVDGKIGQRFALNGFGVAVQDGLDAHTGDGDLGISRDWMAEKKEAGEQDEREVVHSGWYILKKKIQGAKFLLFFRLRDDEDQLPVPVVLIAQVWLWSTDPKMNPQETAIPMT